MQADEARSIVIQAQPPYNIQIPTVEYKGSPKNLFEFCDVLLKKANKTFGTLYHIDEKMKGYSFTSPGAELYLRFTSEDDMMRFLRNFTYIVKINNKHFITPKTKKTQPS